MNRYRVAVADGMWQLVLFAAMLSQALSSNEVEFEVNVVDQKNIKDFLSKLDKTHNRDYYKEIALTVLNIMNPSNGTVFTETNASLPDIETFGDIVIMMLRQTLEDLLEITSYEDFVKLEKEAQKNYSANGIDRSRMKLEVSAIIKKMMGASLTPEDSDAIDKAMLTFSM